MHEAGMECISIVLQCIKPSKDFHKLIHDSVLRWSVQIKIFELFQGLENFISAL